MTKRQRFQKRFFDIILSFLGLLMVSVIILLSAFVAAIDTKSSGFFRSKRIGRNQRPFLMWKIRTMRGTNDAQNSVTVANDPRITNFGRILRKAKIDELPQLWNVLKGDMSLVGPRPDVPGFADELTGHDRIILSIRPGITGPASLKFKTEERLLANQKNPEAYNQDVIWPEKVRLNKEYIQQYSFAKDLQILWYTFF